MRKNEWEKVIVSKWIEIRIRFAARAIIHLGIYISHDLSQAYYIINIHLDLSYQNSKNHKLKIWYLSVDSI